MLKSGIFYNSKLRNFFLKNTFLMDPFFFFRDLYISIYIYIYIIWKNHQTNGCMLKTNIENYFPFIKLFLKILKIFLLESLTIVFFYMGY